MGLSRLIRRGSSLLKLLAPVLVLWGGVWFVAAWWLGHSKPFAASKQLSNTRSVPSPPTNPGEAGGEKFAQIGDRLHLALYERLIDEGQHWMARSHSRRPAKSFQLRSELTGEYEVQENGKVVLPLLGPLPAADRTLPEFEADVATAFERLIGRFAFVSVTVDRKPIYVVGPVKKPGNYKYTPGMTILHLVALAGGFDRAVMDVAHMLQAVREVGDQEKSSGRLKRLWARLAVLQAERDGKPAVPPGPLVALVGEGTAKSMVDAERSLRDFAVTTRKVQDAAFEAAKRSARVELESKKARLAQVETNVELRNERVGALKSIRDRIGRPVLAHAESELSDVKERLQEAIAAVKEAENKVQQVEKDGLTAFNREQMEVEREILTLGGQIAEASSSISANAGALDVMRSALAYAQDGADGDTEFEIIRSAPRGRIVMRASGTAELKPGDLVRIRIRNSPGPKRVAAP